MAYFPFMVDIENWNCLVAGGGRVALHKVGILIPFGVHIRVVAEEICQELWQWEERIEIVHRPFRDDDLDSMDMVVAATDDEELNRHISGLCRQRRVPVNVVDTKDACSFIFPAMIQEKDLLVAVSSGGQSPAAAAYVKRRIKGVLPEYYGDMIERLGECREPVLQRVDTASGRKEVFERLLQYGDAHEGVIGQEVVDRVIDEVTKVQKVTKGRIIRIGTRGSKLALAQTGLVAARLKEEYPEWTIENVILHTEGDRRLDQPLLEFGGKGVFVTEFEEALAQGRIDLAVHSSKDLPMELAEGLTIAGVLPRADARDVLVTGKGKVPSDSLVIGTGSLRRQCQLKELYPNAECISIRGNVPTRLQKVRDGVCDGVVLAAAGLERLGLLEEPDFDYHFFDFDEMIPAGGQGIIAVEGRVQDEISAMMESISDRDAETELDAERAILKYLNAGCHEAVGVFSKVRHEAGEDSRIEICAFKERQGKQCRARRNGTLEEYRTLAESIARELLMRGNED
jgi:hydroxymethylbilane synthase